MRRADKILFDTAKDRVNKSKLDDHSKEGISVALELSGECPERPATLKSS